MTVIEFAGMVGAGKSTIARRLPAMLQDRGITTLERPEAIDRCLERSAVGVITRPIRPPSARRRLRLIAYRTMVRPFFMLMFALRHRESALLAIRSPGLRTLPRWHRRKILQLFFRTAATASFVAPRLRADEAMLLEEGLAHRTVNLFSWDAEGVDRTAVKRFLNGIPNDHLLVFVEASVSTCLNRVSHRGLPSRLSDKDGTTTRLFMDNASIITDIIAEWLDPKSDATITVTNDDSLDAALDMLADGLDRRLASTS